MARHPFKLALLIFGLALFRCAVADPHLRLAPEAYLLQSDIRLSNGQRLAAGTRWYRPPDIERLRREMAEGSYRGDLGKAQRIIFGHDLVYTTYLTVGDGRKDGRPSLGQRAAS